jgi:NTE family protein
MNYKTEAKHFRQQLGYKDGQLAIKTVFEKDPIYISLINEINRTNYLEIKNNMKVETAQRELGASIDKHMEYFNQIADKYKDY